MPNPKVIKGTLKTSIKVDPGYLASQVTRSEVYDTFVDTLLELAARLEQESYIGASSSMGRESLRSGWDVQYPRRETVTFTIEGKVTNTTPNAMERIVGRDAGKFPPLEPLREWVGVKLGIVDEKKQKAIAFLIGRKIAEKGTQRYQDNDNFMGLNRDGTLKPDSIVKEYERILVELLEGL